MIENIDVIINGVLGIYFGVSFFLGLQLSTDFLKLCRGPVTIPMRLIGFSLISDALAIVLGGFLPQVVPHISDFWIDLTVFVDLFTSFLMVLAGFSLLQGGFPRWKTVGLVALFMLLPWLVIWITGYQGKVTSILSNAVSVSFFAILAFKIWRHDKNLNKRFSNIDSTTYSWYIVFSVWVLLVAPFYYVCYYFDVFEGYVRIFAYLIMVIMDLYLARNVALLNVHKPNFELEKAMNEDQGGFDMVGDNLSQPKASDFFTPSELAQMQEHMEKMMLIDKVYRNPELSVDDLSKMMNTNSSYFYYFMRDVLKTNFFDLVNGYRVKQAQEMLLANEKVEIIAQECGYNSANSFRRVFKKITGTTPSQWRAEQA